MRSWFWSTRGGRSGPLVLMIAMVLALAPPTAAAEPLDAPEVTAASVFAYDLVTDETIYEVDAGKRRDMGSLAKIMTALVALEHRAPDAEVVIAEADMVPAGYSAMWLQPGDTLTVEQLLTGLLVPSAGDAALALARDVGAGLSKSDDPEIAVATFVDAMNERAVELGLDDTRFANPVGEDDDDAWSTARDMAFLFGAAQEDERLSEILARAEYGFVSVGPERREYGGLSTNELAGQLGVTGAKTGSTGAAGGCLVLSRTANGGENTVIVALLGSNLVYDESGVQIKDERWADTTTLIEDMDDRWEWGSPEAATAPAQTGVEPAAPDRTLAPPLVAGPSPARTSARIGLAGGGNSHGWSVLDAGDVRDRARRRDCRDRQRIDLGAAPRGANLSGKSSRHCPAARRHARIAGHYPYPSSARTLRRLWATRMNWLIPVRAQRANDPAHPGSRRRRSQRTRLLRRIRSHVPFCDRHRSHD